MGEKGSHGGSRNVSQWVEEKGVDEDIIEARETNIIDEKSDDSS
jgi:hypothetical protein